VGLRTKPTPKEEGQNEAASDQPHGDVKTAIGSEAYQMSVWEGRDGKGGWACKVWVEPINGETIEQAARRANKFGVAKLRELETLMS